MKKTIFIILFGVSMIFASDRTVTIGGDWKDIQAAIDACSNSGGGNVTLEAGRTYLSGTILVKTGVNLKLNGATILAKMNPEEKDYQVVRGNNMVLVGFSSNSNHAGIEGPGYVTYRAVNDDIGGDRGFWGISYANCTDIWAKNLTVIDENAFGFHLVAGGCDGVLFDNVEILTNTDLNGTDGIDIQSCTNVILNNCKIASGDDAIVIVTNSYGVAEDVLIRNSIIYESGSCGLKFGGGLQRNASRITFENITIIKAFWGISIQCRDNDYVTIKDVTYRNIIMGEGVTTYFYLAKQYLGQTGIVDEVKNITFENIAISPDFGHPVSEIRDMDNIVFKNVVYRLPEGYAGNNFKLVTFEDINKLEIRNLRVKIGHTFVENPLQYFSLINITGLSIIEDPGYVPYDPEMADIDNIPPNAPTGIKVIE
jgi:polygalacturonase